MRPCLRKAEAKKLKSKLNQNKQIQIKTNKQASKQVNKNLRERELFWLSFRGFGQWSLGFVTSESCVVKQSITVKQSGLPHGELERDEQRVLEHAIALKNLLLVDCFL